MNNTIGFVKACEKEKELSFIYKWEISNYFSLPQTENMYYLSPSFLFFGCEWCLKVYHNVQPDDEVPVNISLIKLQPRNENHHVKCYIGIQDSEGEEYDSFKIEDNFGGEECERGLICYLDEEQFTDNGVLEDVFIIFCNFYVVTLINMEQQEPTISRFPRSFPSNKEKITNTLCQNMERMLIDQKDCDVILDVSGQEFRAHKAVLRARCVVFSNMFDTEMAENLNGRVNIQDVDPNAFKNVLIYIYSGWIKELSLDSVFEYYRLADKFQLAELREACLEFLEFNISSSNVFRFFLLSARHGDTKLNDIIKRFMIENIRELMATEEWVMLKLQNHPLTVEILEIALHERK